MKNALVAILILILTGFGIFSLVSSIGIDIYPKIAAPIEKASSAIFQKIPEPFSEVISESLNPSPVPLTKDQILAGINRVRLLANSQEYVYDSSICPLATHLLSGNKLTLFQITSVCPNCSQLSSVTFDKRISLDSAIQYIEDDATASAMIKNKKLNSVCLVEEEQRILLIAAHKVIPPSPIPQRMISEDELFQALTEYREAHGAKDLSTDEKLCDYARKRVSDHVAAMNEHKPKESYPNPLKYPLDSHEGFMKDADSGLVFEMTRKQKIAENLAYWPTAQYAVHVIEWGWDSSTEGHKETQLSNDYDSACLSGKQGFFVAIFGK
jgi:hypothetical protein